MYRAVVGQSATAMKCQGHARLRLRLADSNNKVGEPFAFVLDARNINSHCPVANAELGIRGIESGIIKGDVCDHLIFNNDLFGSLLLLLPCARSRSLASPVAVDQTIRTISQATERAVPGASLPEWIKPERASSGYLWSNHFLFDFCFIFRCSIRILAIVTTAMA